METNKKVNKQFAYFLISGIYLLFVLISLVWFAYTSWQIILWVISFNEQYSWWVRIPIILIVTPITMAVTLIGALPLFWLDKIKRNKNSWLGNLYKLIDEK
jgi:hypothetical protein